MLEIDLGGFKGFKHPLNTMIKGLSNKDYHEAGGLSSTRFDLIRKACESLNLDICLTLGSLALTRARFATTAF